MEPKARNEATNDRGKAMDKQSELGRRIKSLRIRQAIRGEELATRVDKSPSWVSKLENGHIRDPGCFSLRDVARELGTSLGELLEGVEK